MWGKTAVEPEVIQCSMVKAPIVYLETVPRQKITFLMEEYKSQEWLAYLVGRKSDSDNFFVEDISIPPHAEASGASAEAEPMHIPKECIGIMHSHHGMGAFHSHTDKTYVDRNFPVSITVARAREGGGLTFDAVSFQKTPCDKPLILKCVVKYVQPPPLFDKKRFLAGAKENIDKGKRKPYVHGKETWRDTYKGLEYEEGIPFPGELGHHYLPMRYRQGLFEGSVTVSKEGVVLSQAEVDDALRRGEFSDI